MNKKDSHSFLPDKLKTAHDLCFSNHDILARLLVGGEEQGVFWHRVFLSGEDEARELENTGDIFTWLENSGRLEDRTKVIRTVVFPALLSDFLHFIYEALDTSRKAKLTVSYALLRKPIQEILFVFEVMLIDLDEFSKRIVDNPQSLHSQGVGGLEVHKARIEKVLSLLGIEDLFDASYLAQLRYDKNSDDGFDGVCNKATHLFTSHPAIKAENMNINFVFSNWESKQTQWKFLYSRLPYILVYSRIIIEKVCSEICRTSPEYLEGVERRSQAGVLLHASDIEARYLNSHLQKFFSATKTRLNKHCKVNGFSEPTEVDLMIMSRTGSFPDESPDAVKKRLHGYELIRRRNISGQKDRKPGT